MPGTGATAPPLGKLRRIALDHQGLLGRSPFGRGPDATLRAIQRLGYVQIDTISVVARAHHHVLQTRVPDYQPAHLDRLQEAGQIFEYWSHAAAYLPMRDYRYAIPKMRAMARGEEHWIRCRDQRLMTRILDRISIDGPLQARDFDTPKQHDASGWWSWKPAKQALEQLFMEGRLMVSRREGFQKVYDLPERVLPPDVNLSEPSTREFARFLIRQALNAHGFADAGNMTYLRRSRELRKAVNSELEQMIGNGVLERFTIASESGKEMLLYAKPEILEARAPVARSSARVLSPFDNAVIQRRRSETVFGFDYQLECYLPASKRRYGYFCLPLLYRDRFVGRADCKAHRRESLMEIRALFIEDQYPRIEEPTPCAGALADALLVFARLNGCNAIQLNRVTPQRWQATLQKALDAASPGDAHPDVTRTD
jgi:uncharacterized protein YcaQ